MLDSVKIPAANQIPEAAHGAEWARVLHCDPTTISRAYKAGQLQRAKSKGRRALYSKAAVLRWLGLSDLN